jgi:hypothetical protein
MVFIATIKTAALAQGANASVVASKGPSRYPHFKQILAGIITNPFRAVAARQALSWLALTIVELFQDRSAKCQ